jgi:uncharacterized protein YjbI with pentapeptide repeats
MATKIQVRRGSSSNWTTTNPVLSEGEIGFETDSGKFKIGNGSSVWSSLDYFGGEVDLSGYLTLSSASTTYLTQASASTTYLTQASASTTYLTQASASNTYLTQASASTTYLTQASASNTYLTQASASTSYKSKTTTVVAEKTGAYTVAIGDENDLIELNGTFTVSIPTNTTSSFPIGTEINLLNVGTGVITIAAVTPGTTAVNATPGLKLRAQWSSATLIKRKSDSWVVIGDLIE